jgi:predicted acetyltransferase
MPDDITLRSPAPDELQDYGRPLADAFQSEFDPEEIEYERPLFELDRLVGAFDGAEQVGGGGAFGFELTVPGGTIAASGITGVGVRPDNRRRGILRSMIDWLFDDARRHGEPVAILFASEAAIYQRFGFGMVTTATSFSIDRMRAVFRDSIDTDRQRIRMVDADEGAARMPAIYEQVRATIPGALSRSEARWKLSIAGDAKWHRYGQGPKYRAILEVDGEPRGYAIYRVNRDWDTTGPQSLLSVVEVVALDAAAEQALWQWLMSIDLVATIVGRRGPNPHPLQQWLAEPRRLSLTVNDGLWLRILDLPTTLAARTYADDGALVLDVVDEMIDSNTGRWQLRVEGGRATVTRTSAAPDLELDIATVAQVYLGAFRFGDLATAGRVRECRPGALQTADLMFTPPRSPWCSTMF